MKITRTLIVGFMVVVWLITQADSAEAKRRGKGTGQRTVDGFITVNLEFELDNSENNQYKISDIDVSCADPDNNIFPCPPTEKTILVSGSLVTRGTGKYIDYGSELHLSLPLCDPKICPKNSTTFPYDTSLKDNILYYPYEITSVPDGLDDITKLDNSSSLPEFFASPSGDPSGFVLYAYFEENSSPIDIDYPFVYTYIPRVDTPSSENNSIALLSSSNADSIPEPSTVAGWLLVGALGLKQLIKK